MILSLLLSIVASLGFSKEHVVKADSWYLSEDAYISSRLDLAFSLYGPGDYFSQNGRACTCHDDNRNCVAGALDPSSGCNCLRLVTIEGKQVDVRGVQCMGYARYIEYVLFGTIELYGTDNPFVKIMGVGSGSTELNTTNLEIWLKTYSAYLHPGTHIRGTYNCHSVVLLGVDYDNKTVTFIECNYGGRCLVSNVQTVSYASFAKHMKTINYAYVYEDYYQEYSDPQIVFENVTVTNTPTPGATAVAGKPTATPKATKTPTPKPEIRNYYPGYYFVLTETDGKLNVRTAPGRSNQSVTMLSYSTVVRLDDFIYDIDGYDWGRIADDDPIGPGCWIAMSYMYYLDGVTASPTPEATATPTNTPTPTDTPVPTATNTPTPTNTLTNTPTPTATNTPIPTATNTPTPTPTNTPTNTPTPTATNTPTPTYTPTNTPTPTATNTPVVDDYQTGSDELNPSDKQSSTDPTPTATNTPVVDDHQTGSDELDPSDKQSSTEPTATNTPVPTLTATSTPQASPTLVAIDLPDGITRDNISSLGSSPGFGESHLKLIEPSIPERGIPERDIPERGIPEAVKGELPPIVMALSIPVFDENGGITPIAVAFAFFALADVAAICVFSVRLAKGKKKRRW
ncbi:MAG: SH3 domain-containing protein [Lachnospiraceae bacterium]|nr:SH3 domain-containing protein [Lachnospiraceae bacterium]